MNEQPYHHLVVWQRADEFAKLVYRLTATFPSDEKYGVTSQFRRAALSVPLNIVEGQARSSTKDFMRFVVIARGSLSECAYLIEFCKSQEYLTHESSCELNNLCRSVNYMLENFLRGLRSR